MLGKRKERCEKEIFGQSKDVRQHNAGKTHGKTQCKKKRYTRHAISFFKIPAMAGADSAQTVTFWFYCSPQ